MVLFFISEFKLTKFGGYKKEVAGVFESAIKILLVFEKRRT
jgi:hypothetical protein